MCRRSAESSGALLLRRGLCSGHEQLAGLCGALRKRRDWLWTFTKVQGIEPTNNAAERALRLAVIHRKLSIAPRTSRAAAIWNGS